MTGFEQASQPPQPPHTVADFFRDTVHQLLQNNRDYILGASLTRRRNVQILHLVDPIIPKELHGLPIGYHFAYKAVDRTKQATTHGIYIDRPLLRHEYGDDAPKRGVSRHYFDAGEELVVRHDKLPRRENFEFLQGSSLDPALVEDPEIAALISNFRADMNTVTNSTPVDARSIVFDTYVKLNLL